MTANHLLRRFAGLWKNRGGMAAVEFALLLPFMLLLYLGSYQIVQMISVKRLVTLTASTVANVTTQYASISASQTMPDILNASAAVLTPNPVANAKVVVSLITIDSSGKATIAWSQALNGVGRPTGQTVNLPASLDVPKTSLVWGETTYAYTPVIDFLHTGTINLYSSVFMLPRASSGTIALTT